MLIRRASAADAEQVHEHERILAIAGRGMVIAPDQVGPVDALRIRLMDPARTTVVAEIDGRIAGVADLKHLQPIRCNHVGVVSIGVHPDFQRRGIGRKLMEHLIDHAKASGLSRLELYVRSDNGPAQALYVSLGFTHEGTRAKFIRLDDGTLIDDYIFVRFVS